MDIREIERLYYEEKLSTREVAEELNIGKTTVNYIINHQLNGVRTGQEAHLYRKTPEYRKMMSERLEGEHCYNAKLTEEIVKVIRIEYEKMLQLGAAKTTAQIQLAYKYGVKRTTISDVVLRRTWKRM